MPVEATVLKRLKAAFDFLVSDFNFHIVSEHVDKRSVVIYRNNYVQIECAGSDTWFHAEIRRLVDGEPASYDDKTNSIGFEQIAQYESNYEYDHLSYFAGGGAGLDSVLRNTAELFKRNSSIISTANWIDIEKLRDLEDSYCKRTFGRVPSRNQSHIFDVFDDISSDVLSAKGYKKQLDSRKLAPYDAEHWPMKLMYSNGKNSIKIAQLDWRDDYTTFVLWCNGKGLARVDLTKYPNLHKAAEVLKDALAKA